MKIPQALPLARGPISRASLGALVLASFLSASTLPAEDSLASLTKSFFEKAIASAKEIVTGEKAEGPEEAAEGENPEETARENAVSKARDAIFLEEGGYHFTQSRWGAKPMPYQVEGLEMVPLGEATLTAGDEAAGIDQRLTYAFQATRHRRFHEQTGWGRWIEGAPPHLDHLVLVRENGLWKVVSSPTWAYSLN